jgi:hypothetical protein
LPRAELRLAAALLRLLPALPLPALLPLLSILPALRVRILAALLGVLSALLPLLTCTAAPLRRVAAMTTWEIALLLPVAIHLRVPCA